MKALTVGLMVFGLMGIALVGITSPGSPVNKVVIGVLDFEMSGIDLCRKKVREASIETVEIPIDLEFRGICQKLLTSQDLNRVLREKKKVLGVKEVAVSREIEDNPEETEDFLIQNGPKLIAESEYRRVLKLIEDLSGETRRHAQVKTLECFANLKGWVIDRDHNCKLRWWQLWRELINKRANEATPILVFFLKDEDPRIRLYATELLGYIGDKRALKALKAVWENDENLNVRKKAKWAYEQISKKKF